MCPMRVGGRGIRSLGGAISGERQLDLRILTQRDGEANLGDELHLGRALNLPATCTSARYGYGKAQKPDTIHFGG